MLSTLRKIGEDHTTCDDSMFVHETDGYVMGVVADGCSSGVNSEFASGLICKLIKHYIMGSINRGLIPEVTFDVLIKTNRYVKLTMMNLGMDSIEMLTTMLFFKYDKSTKDLTIQVLGDGVLKLNDTLEILNQSDNKVDYFIEADSFREHLNKYPIRIYKGIESFIISTDGPLSYKKSELYESNMTTDILFSKPTNTTYLQRMHNILSRNHWYHTDDVTMISYDSSK